ncbi:MAG: glycosyltransferase family 87 protein [Planctomycetia bacterium]
MIQEQTAATSWRWILWSGLTTRQRTLVVGVVVLFLAFGAVVENRSAFLKRRMTDFCVYARAAWAVRTGNNLYGVVDTNGWRYAYPPLLAIALTPLADAPAGHDRAGLTPFAVGVAAWYLFGVLCLFLTLHWSARAAEIALDAAGRAPPPPGSRAWLARWWLLRAAPLAVVLPAVGNTLSRGQVNLLLTAMLAGAALALVKKRSAAQGAWIAVAAAVKIVPAYLFLEPLARRDLRALVAGSVVLFLGLWGVPSLTLGPVETIDAYRSLNERVLAPGLGAGGDATMRTQLTGMNATRSQSPMAALHNVLHLERPRKERPAEASAFVRAVHWSLVGGLTLAVLAVGRRPASANAALVDLLRFTSLTTLSALASPVCHLHYLTFALPLAASLLACVCSLPDAARRHTAGRWLGSLFGGFFAVNIIVLLPGAAVLQDLGVAGLWTLMLVVSGIAALHAVAVEPAVSPTNADDEPLVLEFRSTMEANYIARRAA